MREATEAREATAWKTYRTRFLVKAKQLNSNLSFVDSLGRQHSGRKGDYLVESSDGVLCIHPRQIFEDVYVPMARPSESPMATAKIIGLEEAARIRRKAPQPYRDRRAYSVRMGLM
jgi:hypothetical protein